MARPAARLRRAWEAMVGMWTWNWIQIFRCNCSPLRGQTARRPDGQALPAYEFTPRVGASGGTLRLVARIQGTCWLATAARNDSPLRSPPDCCADSSRFSPPAPGIA